MATIAYSNDNAQHWNRTKEEALLPVYLGSNDHIPQFLYKEFPIAYLLIGAVINLILLYYLIASKKYRSPLFTFIASLTISDALSCIGFAGWAGFILPYVVLPRPALVCKLVFFTGNMGVAASGFHLMFFSVLRYYQLCFPLHARANVTANVVLKACLVIWIATLVFHTTTTLYYESIKIIYEENVVSVCEFVGNVSIRNWCYLIISTLMPCGTIIIMHVLKYIHLLFHAKSLDVQQERQNADARAVTIVIVLFFISWCPANIYGVAHTLAPGEGYYQDKLLLTLIYTIAYNSTLNPVVYVLAAKSIRSDIVNFLWPGQKRA